MTTASHPVDNGVNSERCWAQAAQLLVFGGRQAIASAGVNIGLAT